MDSGKTSKIFNKVAEAGAEFVGSCFGEVGRKLISLFEVLGNHPETDDLFFEDSDLALRDLLMVAGRAKIDGMVSFISKLPEVAEFYASEKFKNTKDLGKNTASARLLRDPIREKVRSFRKIQHVGSDRFLKSIIKDWSFAPSDFSPFKKNSLNSAPDRLVSIAENFEKIGCEGLAESSNKLLRRYFRPDSFFAYKKLRITDAACILAKYCGLEIKDGSVFVETASGRYSYAVAVVPLPLLRRIPSQVQERVHESEFCRDLLFCPAFDHYFVVVPLLGERVCDSLGTFPDVRDAVQALDDQILNAVVLGERDGECYFICEWKNVN